ncbi:phosphotransferase [Nakamurella endophytica]|uniref:Aminoglycoside phosphotransferase domain-containing protein n=1 Tax=Nakamurella endophytica TaxID=1748367 RepID=A0A917WFX5_9ACTN|nr:phosphotransferase [Nakamurella endophytica]GGM00481.1 hypothetical protein GCM10011594_20700 [Nakamurella endophytica]
MTPVWRNEAGGLTVHDRAADRFVKISPPGAPDLTAEAARLRWVRHVAPDLPVPVVVNAGADDAGSWLVTRALPGRSAVDPWCRARPAVAAAAIGSGLRRLHDTLPVDRCPFDWSAAARVRRVPDAAGQDPRRWHADHREVPAAAAVAAVRRPPPVDRAVVCHGDACAPNTLVGAGGT